MKIFFVSYNCKACVKKGEESFMLIKKNVCIKMRNGKNGVDVRNDTDFRVGRMKSILEIEAPFQVRGGVIEAYNIGAFCMINRNAYFRAINSMGRCCMIGPNVVAGLPEHSSKSVSSHYLFPNFDSDWIKGFTDYVENNQESISIIREKQNRELENKRWITIGNDVWIGGNVMIARGVTIGDGSIIGAGTLVVKDVPPYAIVGGVPAKIIKYRFPKEIIDRLGKIQWWKYGPDIMKGCDITLVEKTISEMERRIDNGFPRYNAEKIIINANDNTVYPSIDYSEEK